MGTNQLQTNAHSGAIFSSSESQLHGGAGLGICLIFGLPAEGINQNGEIRCLRSAIGLDWIGLDWIGLDWIGLDLIGLVLNLGLYIIMIAL